jgi:hypothetical protein
MFFKDTLPYQKEVFSLLVKLFFKFLKFYILVLKKQIAFTLIFILILGALFLTIIIVIQSKRIEHIAIKYIKTVLESKSLKGNRFKLKSLIKNLLEFSVSPL